MSGMNEICAADLCWGYILLPLPNGHPVKPRCTHMVCRPKSHSLVGIFFIEQHLTENVQFCPSKSHPLIEIYAYRVCLYRGLNDAGTLTPIVKDPDRAYMSDQMRDAVRRIATLFPTAIISGRGREKVGCQSVFERPILHADPSCGVDSWFWLR